MISSLNMVSLGSCKWMASLYPVSSSWCHKVHYFWQLFAVLILYSQIDKA